MNNPIKICSVKYLHEHPAFTPDYLLVDSSVGIPAASNPYLTATLPILDTNQCVQDYLQDSELSIPVIAGVSFTDPYRQMKLFLPELSRHSCVKGFMNFPSCAYENSSFFTEMSDSHIGFEDEYDVYRNTFSPATNSFAVVHNMKQAQRYGQLGVYALVLSSSAPVFWTAKNHSAFSSSDLKALRQQFPHTLILRFSYENCFSFESPTLLDGTIYLA